MKDLLQLICMILLLKTIKCSAIISIELLNYTNPRGTNIYGKKCDAFPGGLETLCDPSFYFCIYPRPTNTGSCIWTNIWMNKNTIQFSRGMEIAPKKKNPLLYEFGTGFKDEIRLNIVARDEDGLFDDQMDMLKATIPLSGTAKYRVISLRGEISSLSLGIRILCSSKDHLCKERCTPTLNKEMTWVCKETSTCIPRDDERGHYECDAVTGKKKCLPGWDDERNNCINDVRSEVSCSTNYMRIDIDRKYFDPTKYSAITLLDSSCKVTLSKLYITLDSMPHKCGSNRIQTNDYIVYENEVYMKAIPTDALITREHDVRIRFKCSYNRSDITWQKSFRPLTSIDVQEDAALLYTRPNEHNFSYGKKGYGTFKFHIQMYEDQKYNKLQTKFPVAIKLNELIYLEVNSTSTDRDLVLLIDQCYATPTLDFKHPSKHIFIERGCPKDKTITFYKGDSKQKRFSVNTFAFIQRSHHVYIHCIALICRKSSAQTKCVHGCNGDIVNRAGRDVHTQFSSKGWPHTKYYLVNIGPFEEAHNQDIGSHGNGKEQRGAFQVIKVILLVSISLLAMIAIAMLIKIVKRRPDNRDVKEGAGME